ncbi:MAG TPA: hypothetical protein VE032_09280 [Actinomycetota bacterium]|nr:hypothetical protein [Actinomycetota bacterium]
MGIYGSSGRTTNPMGGLGVFVGLLAAGCSAVLWIHYFDPATTLFGDVSVRIATGDLEQQLTVLAATFGLMAVIGGIAGGLGGRGSGTTVASLLLGIVGLSYPVLHWVQNTTGGIGSPV